jgi:hypothetical protein
VSAAADPQVGPSDSTSRPHPALGYLRRSGLIAPAAGWSLRRRRCAGAALLTAALTAAAAATLGGFGLFVAAFYVVLATTALFVPGAVTLQVVAGLLMAAGLLLPGAGRSPLLVLPIVAAVALTAELLGIAWRLAAPGARDVHEDRRRALVATAVAGGVYGVVTAIGGLPGPTGHLAIALSAAACFMVALLFVRGER